MLLRAEEARLVVWAKVLSISDEGMKELGSGLVVVGAAIVDLIQRERDQ